MPPHTPHSRTHHPPSHGTGSCGPRARPPRARCTAPAGSGAGSGPWLRLLLLSRVPTTLLLTAPWQRPCCCCCCSRTQDGQPPVCVWKGWGFGWSVSGLECAFGCVVFIAINPGCKPQARRSAGQGAHPPSSLLEHCNSKTISKAPPPPTRGREPNPAPPAHPQHLHSIAHACLNLHRAAARPRSMVGPRHRGACVPPCPCAARSHHNDDFERTDSQVCRRAQQGAQQRKVRDAPEWTHFMIEGWVGSIDARRSRPWHMGQQAVQLGRAGRLLAVDRPLVSSRR